MSFKNYGMYNLCVLCHVMQYELCAHVIGQNGGKDKKETY
jgi:hypothetical protein